MWIIYDYEIKGIYLPIIIMHIHMVIINLGGSDYGDEYNSRLQQNGRLWFTLDKPANRTTGTRRADAIGATPRAEWGNA